MKPEMFHLLDCLVTNGQAVTKALQTIGLLYSAFCALCNSLLLLKENSVSHF